MEVEDKGMELEDKGMELDGSAAQNKRSPASAGIGGGSGGRPGGGRKQPNVGVGAASSPQTSMARTTARSLFGADSPLPRKAPVVRCPERHLLSARQKSPDGATCDVCKLPICITRRCDVCNYDLCTRCYSNRASQSLGKVAAREEEEEAEGESAEGKEVYPSSPPTEW